MAYLKPAVLARLNEEEMHARTACQRVRLPSWASLDQGGPLRAPPGRRQRSASALGRPGRRAPALSLSRR